VEITSISYIYQASCEGFAQVLDWVITLPIVIFGYNESWHLVGAVFDSQLASWISFSLILELHVLSFNLPFLMLSNCLYFKKFYLSHVSP
jgi:hypothetical protein